MPLPANGTVWPPVQMRRITPHLRAWDAWFSGDPIKLAEHYGFAAFVPPGYPAPRPTQYYGGVVGALARFFWGQPVNGQQLSKSHIPIAADICQASADLLYAEPPVFTVTDATGTATQDRLDALTDDTLHGVIGEGAEIGAALGGHYLQVSWDRSVVADKPFLTCVHADAALPEFRYGRLTAVTFWTTVKYEGQEVWRHLTRHELDANGTGIILHGLYKGGIADLGRAVPLTEADATAPLARPGVLSDGNQISTLTPGLGCVYIPSQRPQRRWRNDPIGANLGRSVLDGIEHMMDELDEIHSSWMRDIRLGKARVFVARDLLENHGAGQGASWDSDQEIYAPLNVAPGSLNPNGSSGTANGYLMAQQFAIRTADFAAAAQAKTLDIIRGAGFSPQTFGIPDTSGRQPAMTATEIQARQDRSYMSRDRQILLVRPQLSAILTKLLAVDKAVFNTAGSDPTPVDVAFPDGVQDSPSTVAQTVSALAAARAASTETLVQMVHPDWDDTRVATEVARIHAEDAAAAPALPDPARFDGLGGNGGGV